MRASSKTLTSMATGLLAAACLFFANSAKADPQHAIAMHGTPKYASGFTHFDYVNPDAPKGGRLVLSAPGSFDSLNQFIIKGNAAPGMREYVLEGLLTRSQDEPFTLYGLLAETVETPEDRSWVTFTLRPGARFSDGKPVTVDDVIFSIKLLREKGRPFHRANYSKVKSIEKIGERGVKLTFSTEGDREMPLIMGLMPILAKHTIDPETFERSSLEPPIGSGPYIVDQVDPGVRLSLKRNPDYWGRNLPVNRGMFNFGEIAYEYYRDGNAMFEAFKKGLYDMRTESDPGRWARNYDFPAITKGQAIKAEFEKQTPAGMNGLVFNTRRPVFADRRVREALILLFDFEWINVNLYHGLYERTQSYFHGSELSSYGHPADAREKALLAPYAGAVAAKIMDGTEQLPRSDGSGRDRASRRKALRLLKQAGYELTGGRMMHKSTGKPLSFEMLAATRSQERLFLNYTRALNRIGIRVKIRQIDSAQYWARKTNFNFDMIQHIYTASLSPGNEQIYRWSSQSAETVGSFNYPGAKSKAADAMMQAMLNAKNREDFISATRAFDRVLRSGAYVIPLYNLPKQWVAHWQRLAYPETTPIYGFQINSWWIRDAARTGSTQTK